MSKLIKHVPAVRRPLDIKDCHNEPFSYTVDVSTNKYIKLNKQNLGQWKQLSNDSQTSFLRLALQKAYYEIGLDFSEGFCKFELTQKGHVHCHGMIYTTLDLMLRFQDVIFEVCGLPRVDKSITCKIDVSYKSDAYWLQYATKDQGNNRIELDSDGSKIGNYIDFGYKEPESIIN